MHKPVAMSLFDVCHLCLQTKQSNIKCFNKEKTQCKLSKCAHFVITVVEVFPCIKYFIVMKKVQTGHHQSFSSSFFDL